MNEMRLPDHIDQHDLLGLIVEHARSAILLIGKGRRPLYANQAFLDMSGYSYDEWMALERTSALTPERDQLNTGNSLNRALQGDATPFRPRAVIRQDGSEVWVDACVTTLPIAGEGLLLAEFRPPRESPPDGGVAWDPSPPGAS